MKEIDGKKYADLLEFIPVPCLIIDEEGTISGANKRFLQLLAYSKVDLLGEPILNFVDNKDHQAFKLWKDKGLVENAFEELTINFTTKSGGLLILQINAQLRQESSTEEVHIICTFCVVTKLNKAKKALELSEQKFKGLLDSTPDAMVIVDKMGKITHVNRQAIDCLGYSAEELIGERIEILIPPRFRKNHVSFTKKFIKTPRQRQMGRGIELFAIKKNGVEFPVEISLNYQKVGGEIFVLAAIRDISERKRNEEMLNESQERFLSAFEYAAIGMALVSLEGKWTKVNQSVCDIVGYTKDELMEMTFQDITHPDDLDIDLRNVEKVLKGEIKSYKIEKRYFHKTGKVVWVLLSVSLVRSLRNEPLYFISQIEDITEWKETQDALMQSEERFRLAENGTGLGIWEWNKSPAKDYLSGKFCELLGYQQDELYPDLSQLKNFIHPDFRTKVRKSITKHFTKGQPFRVEFQLMKKNGEYGWFSTAGQAQYNGKGKPIRMVGYLIDISERKRAEEKFEVLFNASPDGILMLNKNREISLLNSQVEELFGIEGEEILGKSIDKYIQDFTTKLDEELAMLSKNEEDQFSAEITFDACAFHNDKGKFSAEVALNILQIDHEYTMIVSIRDVTERLKADVERKRILAALNVATDGIFMFDMSTLQHVYVNAGAAKQVGYTEGELLTMTPLDFKVEFTEQSFRELLKPLSTGEKSSITIETIHRHKNGEDIHVEIIFQTALHEYTSKIIVAVVRNITERKLAEEALHLSKERFRELYENSTFGIYRTRKDGHIVLANPALIKLLGFDSLEDLQERNLEIEGYDFKKARKEFVNKIEKEKKVNDIESIWVKKDGTKIYVRESARLIIDKHTGEHFYDGTVEDISEKKQAEKEKIARRAAEEASKAKSMFLANMSHEIRTPLNSIIGFSDILYASFEGSKAQSQIDSIRKSGKNLLRIINEILDLSKIEAGKLELQIEPVRFDKIINEIEVMFKQKAKEKDISFFVETEKKLPAGLKLDEVRIRQILLNLIGNAIKFTEHGNVILSIDVVTNPNESIDLIFVVEDTGIGIKSDQLENIFQPFTQQEGQLEKKFGGTGLGLSITKRLIEMMEGTISVNSELGKGSIFRVVLPGIPIASDILEDEEKSFFNPASLFFEKARILVADDNAENRKLLRDFLEHSPVEILEARNGLEAIELTKSSTPDLILMDLRMPKMNGIDAAKIIKGDKTTSKLPIIATSASSKIVFKEQTYSEVFDDFVMKPIVLSELAESLKKYLKYKDKNVKGAAQNMGLAVELTDEQLLALPELIDVLEKKFVPLSKKVLKKQLIDDMDAFGRDLIIEGSFKSNDLLVDFGEEICMYADNFEIDKLLEKLKDFPQLVKKLKTFLN